MLLEATAHLLQTSLCDTVVLQADLFLATLHSVKHFGPRSRLL
jgi:hypothetical protein